MSKWYPSCDISWGRQFYTEYSIEPLEPDTLFSNWHKYSDIHFCQLGNQLTFHVRRGFWNRCYSGSSSYQHRKRPLKFKIHVYNWHSNITFLFNEQYKKLLVSCKWPWKNYLFWFLLFRYWAVSNEGHPKLSRLKNFLYNYVFCVARTEPKCETSRCKHCFIYYFIWFATAFIKKRDSVLTRSP